MYKNQTRIAEENSGVMFNVEEMSILNIDPKRDSSRNSRRHWISRNY